MPASLRGILVLLSSDVQQCGLFGYEHRLAVMRTGVTHTFAISVCRCCALHFRRLKQTCRRVCMEPRGSATRGNIAVLGRVEAVLRWNTVHLTAVLPVGSRSLHGSAWVVSSCILINKINIKPNNNTTKHTHYSLYPYSHCVCGRISLWRISRSVGARTEKKDTACA